MQSDHGDIFEQQHRPPDDAPQAVEAQLAEATETANDQPRRTASAWQLFREQISLPMFDFAVLWTLLMMAAQVVLALVFLTFVAVLAMAGLFNMPSKPEEMNQVLVPVGTMTTLLTALAVAWLLFGRETWRKLGVRGFAAQHGLLVVLLVFPLAVVAGEVGNLAAEVLPQFDLEWIEQIGQQSWLLVFVSACLLPGVGEEIYFRGFLSRGLVARHGVIAGSLLASLLFALMHLAPVQICGTFVLGLGMQYVFLTTRSLLAPMMLHVLNNTLAFAAVKYEDQISIQGATDMPMGEVQHIPLPLIVAALASVSVIVALLYQTRTRWILPDGRTWSLGYLATERPPESLGAMPVSALPNIVLVLLLLLVYAALAYSILWASGLVQL
jgi:membrane protease YdiL (CAAX protease family)